MEKPYVFGAVAILEPPGDLLIYHQAKPFELRIDRSASTNVKPSGLACDGDPPSLPAAIPSHSYDAKRRAALLAGLPLMLGHGTDSEILQPLESAMVGGLLFTQVSTLYTTPVVYLYLSRFQGRLYRRAVVAEELSTASAELSSLDRRRDHARCSGIVVAPRCIQLEH